MSKKVFEKLTLIRENLLVRAVDAPQLDRGLASADKYEVRRTKWAIRVEYHVQSQQFRFTTRFSVTHLQTWQQNTTSFANHFQIHMDEEFSSSSSIFKRVKCQLFSKIIWKKELAFEKKNSLWLSESYLEMANELSIDTERKMVEEGRSRSDDVWSWILNKSIFLF